MLVIITLSSQDNNACGCCVLHVLTVNGEMRPFVHAQLKFAARLKGESLSTAHGYALFVTGIHSCIQFCLMAVCLHVCCESSELIPCSVYM